MAASLRRDTNSGPCHLLSVRKHNLGMTDKSLILCQIVVFFFHAIHGRCRYIPLPALSSSVAMLPNVIGGGILVALSFAVLDFLGSILKGQLGVEVDQKFISTLDNMDKQGEQEV